MFYAITCAVIALIMVDLLGDEELKSAPLACALSALFGIIVYRLLVLIRCAKHITMENVPWGKYTAFAIFAPWKTDFINDITQTIKIDRSDNVAQATKSKLVEMAENAPDGCDMNEIVQEGGDV